MESDEVGKYALRGVDEAAVWEALRAVVTEKPDFRYVSPSEWGNCLYVHGTGEEDRPRVPGCGIGAMLHRLGADLENLAEYEGHPAVAPLSAFVPGLPSPTRSAMDVFQDRQDGGMSWGLALKTAERHYLMATGRPAPGAVDEAAAK